MTFLLYSDQCFAQPSSEKCPPAGDGRKQRPIAKHHAEKDLGTLIPKWDASIKSLPRAQGTTRKQQQKERKNQRGQRSPKPQGPLHHHEQHSYELTETGAACPGPAQVCTRASVLILGLPMQCSHEIPGVQMSGTLTLVPSLGFFYFC